MGGAGRRAGRDLLSRPYADHASRRGRLSPRAATRDSNLALTSWPLRSRRLAELTHARRAISNYTAGRKVRHSRRLLGDGKLPVARERATRCGGRHRNGLLDYSDARLRSVSIVLPGQARISTRGDWPGSLRVVLTRAAFGRCPWMLGR